MMLIEDSWAFVFAILGAVGSIATAAALYFLWKQSHQMQEQINRTREEMDNTLRPWIGIGKIEVKFNRLVLELKNYGKVPARVVKTWEIVSPKIITQEQLRSAKDTMAHEFMHFPDSVEQLELSVGITFSDNYVGLLIKYVYAMKEGESGIIARYDRPRRRFEILKVFAN